MITWDRKSFLVDGQRIWLHSAAIHYFRHPAGHFIEHFGELLAESEEVEESSVVVPAGARRIERSTPAGGLLFITAADSRVEIPVRLGNGRELVVALTRTRGAVLPVDLNVLPGVTLDYAKVQDDYRLRPGSPGVELGIGELAIPLHGMEP